MAQTDDAAGGTIVLGGDLPVHRLGFGAMRITGRGVWGPPDDRTEALAVLRRAVELGVTLIDTAESYGPHVSEELIAEALHPYPAGLVVATKGGFDRPGPGRWTENCRPARLLEELEGSLRRLRLERIDLYQLHRVDPAVPEVDQFGLLQRLQQEGKDPAHRALGGIGDAGGAGPEVLRRRVGAEPVQPGGPPVGGRAGLLRARGDRVPARDPLQVGKVGQQGGAVTEIAERHGSTASQVALAWLLRRSPVMLPIPGTGRVRHLEENMAAARLQLSEAEVVELTGRPN